MLTPELLREQANACRLAASYGPKVSHVYLIKMAERYERQAAELEAAYAGSKPPVILSITHI